MIEWLFGPKNKKAAKPAYTPPKSITYGFTAQIYLTSGETLRWEGDIVQAVNPQAAFDQVYNTILQNYLYGKRYTYDGIPIPESPTKPFLRVSPTTFEKAENVKRIIIKIGGEIK